MKREKFVFYFALLAFYVAISSCTKEEVFNIKASGVTSDFTFTVSDLKITATSGATNFTKLIWTFGDGTNSTEANPSKTYDKGGEYAVQLAAYGAEGAVALKEVKVTVVDPRPVSDFTVKLEELTATLTDKSKLATSYLWDFGNGTTSTSASPNVTYPELTGATPKVYTIKLTVTNAKGTSSSTQDITIFPVPVPNFTFTIDATSPETDPGRVVTFVNSAENATSYKWDFGDNTTSTEANVVKTYNIKFSYQVTFTAINDRRKVSVTKTVNLN
jgi:PKD repeat protein